MKKYLPLILIPTVISLLMNLSGVMAVTNTLMDLTSTQTASNKTLTAPILNGATAGADPTTALGVATKQYVDNKTGASVPTGGMVPFGASSAPTGWLICDGSAVSRTTYAALYAVIGSTYGAGDGSTTFNLPDRRGRTSIGSGTGTFSVSGTNGGVDTTGDTFTVPANNTEWITGQPVVFTLSSGSITPLVSGTTYYVIRSSSTLIQLASSLANAQNGTAINMTAKSSPVWTLTATLTARTLGEYGGEEAHATSSTELLAHTHSVSGGAGGGGQFYRIGDASGPEATSSTGGNNAANIMQPFVVDNWIIKT